MHELVNNIPLLESVHKVLIGLKGISKLINYLDSRDDWVYIL